MTTASDKPTREERLAARLRQNLRRRKAQTRDLARALARQVDESTGDALPKPGADS